MPNLTVYHIPETRSERVVWLLEELGMPFQIRRLSYRRGDLRKSEFLAVNPFGMVPAICDGDMPLRETGAIFEHILKLGGGRLTVPPGDPAYADYLQWLHSAEATLFQPLAGFIMHRYVLPEGQRIEPYAQLSLETWRRFADILDAHLGHYPYAAHEQFSAADVIIGNILRLARLSDVPLAPASADYLARLSDRPAFQAMMSRAAEDGGANEREAFHRR